MALAHTSFFPNFYGQKGISNALQLFPLPFFVDLVTVNSVFPYYFGFPVGGCLLPTYPNPLMCQCRRIFFHLNIDACWLEVYTTHTLWLSVALPISHFHFSSHFMLLIQFQRFTSSGIVLPNSFTFGFHSLYLCLLPLNMYFYDLFIDVVLNRNHYCRTTTKKETYKTTAAAHKIIQINVCNSWAKKIMNFFFPFFQLSYALHSSYLGHEKNRIYPPPFLFLLSPMYPPLLCAKYRMKPYGKNEIVNKKRKKNAKRKEHTKKEEKIYTERIRRISKVNELVYMYFI